LHQVGKLIHNFSVRLLFSLCQPVNSHRLFERRYYLYIQGQEVRVSSSWTAWHQRWNQ